jgi:hypothetical protein
MTNIKPSFKLNNREEVHKFEKLLTDYSTENSVREISYLNLLNIYDRLLTHENGENIFTAILDLKINLALLNYDNVAALRAWGGKINNELFSTDSILDSKEMFFQKMDLHRHNNAFIFRYRAVWDKIMGLLVLMHSPKDYERFLGARSRKKTFVKVAKTLPHLFDDESINAVTELLTKFDDEFRTPEAHATGRLRKFSFTIDIDNNPSEELIIDYWNMLIVALAEIDKNFTS